MMMIACSVLGIVFCRGTSRIIEGPKSKIAFEDEGEGGIPVILLHSFGGEVSHWEDVRQRLSGSRRVISIELRGHGRSGPPEDGDFSIYSMTKDVEAVAKFLHLNRFVLVGHSMGGSVALEYAGEHPEQVAGLFIVDSGGDPNGIPEGVRDGVKSALRSEAYEQTTYGYWEQLLAKSNPMVKTRIWNQLAGMPKKTVIGVTESLLDYDPSPALKNFSGLQYAVVTTENNGPLSLHKLGSGFSYTVMEGVGHWLHLDKPDEFFPLLKGFLDDVQSS
ncbi:alpha/beta hydrolase family protein [Leptospira broomii serovar Hurstbridge str. 5399]|uniref:Alpha/beta hydrolase family protein n=1 Tax=Leptospira broomii serovar Hurstbridge str. 5399 TaxID=1049789 RepID=T0FDT2_9LEPT|nr:alpha/beta hydrolase [Leptospira broomii]EQA45772.1 alpha/beta hydrolase family protein [Leptospira broomii serovar Hurstbridge str. 5399]